MAVELRIQDIDTYYGYSHILQGVSLEVPKGQVVGLLGRNGMGKTTLLRSIIGFTPPRKGKILFRGRDLTHLRSYDISRLGLSLIPQGRQIFPSLNVTENLTVAARGQGWTVEKIFDLFPPLAERSGNSGNQLSGGEQQMLAIGRSLMTNPELILMDEPTEGLSPLFVQVVGDAVRAIKDQGTTILLVEQNLQFALRHADHVHIMSKGRIVYSDTPARLEADEEVQAQHLGV